MQPPNPCRLLDTKAPANDVATAPRTGVLRAGEAPRAIVCVECRARVTDASLRIEVAGQHEHTFFNPEGVVYRVACFSAAPGCSGVGAFSAVFSWFPGYRWQVAICAQCLSHLGWHFEGDATFSALIRERIQELD